MTRPDAQPTDAMSGPDAFHAVLGQEWAEEGTAHRTAVSRTPVRHILVEGERLWCSGGRGRPDSNPHSRRYCPTCVRLARDHIEEYGDE